MIHEERKSIIRVFITSFIFICAINLSSCGTYIKSSKRTVMDMESNIIELPTNIERVACISPSATDLMIGFGLGDKIVGTYRSFLYNPWVYDLYPKAKGFKSYSYSVSAEELLNDNIQLVILQDTENAESIRKAGIPVVAVHQYAIDGQFDDELFDTVNILSTIFPEIRDKANKWIKDVKETIDNVNIKNDKENIIYYINGEKSKGLYYSDGANSMIEYLLKTMKQCLATTQYGVLNVHDVSDEEMISLNPDAMIIGGVYQNKLIKELYNSNTWSFLKCVKKDNVFRIPVCMVGIENISIETPIMIKYLANIFCDANYDIYNEFKTTIKEYFNYNLKNEEIDMMFRALNKEGIDMANE